MDRSLEAVWFLLRSADVVGSPSLPVSLLITCLFLGHPVVVDFPLLSVILLATYHWVVPPAKAVLVFWVPTG